MDVAARLKGLRRKLKDDGAPAALISLTSNLKYITAFDGVIDRGINAACLITDERAVLFTDSRYIEAATTAAAGGPWEVRLQKENLYVELCEELHSMDMNSLLIESGVPYGRFQFVSEQFRGAVRVVDRLVETLRHMKEPEEIERIAAAAAIADRGFEHILTVLKPGVTEAEIALELEFAMRREGSEEMPFSLIVASGPNGARPHAIPGDRRLEPGDFVVLDFGARVGGYCSDMTRTVAIGEISKEHRRLYEAVLEANEAGLSAVRSGVPCIEIDLAAREVLDRQGLGAAFTHGLGHGVGLDVHEMPTVGPKSTDAARENAVITIEPGVYVEGTAGVRIEDLVVVEEHGVRILSSAPKELIQI
ncbi:MAG: aminopeptidase P family protein [Coriobacteriia bacterium]|nr:aminopeptidase P family protein [Coriobacteriia bacterium]